MSSGTLLSTGTLRNFVGGEYVEADGDDALDLVDPATEEVYGSAPISSSSVSGCQSSIAVHSIPATPMVESAISPSTV